MNEITDILDPGIADVVYMLRREGFNTFSSCQGGKGHDFSLPMVRIHPENPIDMRPEIMSIAETLADAGYRGFYIKAVQAFQGARPWLPETQSFIEVEFWSELL